MYFTKEDIDVVRKYAVIKAFFLFDKSGEDTDIIHETVLSLAQKINSNPNLQIDNFYEWRPFIRESDEILGTLYISNENVKSLFTVANFELCAKHISNTTMEESNSFKFISLDKYEQYFLSCYTTKRRLVAASSFQT